LDGRIVPLTYHEFELLQIFCRQLGRVVPYEDLVDNLWGLSDRAALRRLNVVVHRLRAKLGDLRHYRIETVRGRGYGLLEVLGDTVEITRLAPRG
jgi:two-component system alkaline phosphatase synthesis response regulator PhoP